ncbi:MAG: hypothetical protein ACREX3_13645, partial [Gammaproteobacteria bacterium]
MQKQNSISPLPEKDKNVVQLNLRGLHSSYNRIFGAETRRVSYQVEIVRKPKRKSSFSLKVDNVSSNMG